MDLICTFNSHFPEKNVEIEKISIFFIKFAKK